MGTRVFLDGQVVTPENARVSVFDRQFLYGDGVYETVRTFGGRPFMNSAHLRRLHRSASSIGLRYPWTDRDLEDAVDRTLQEAGNPESSIRIIMTRGEGAFGLDPTGVDDPRLVIIVRPLPGVPPELASRGVDVSIPSIRRTSTRALASTIKSGNYLNQAMALAEGKRRGSYEVIMLNEEGFLAEGSTSNVFLVRDGTLLTPSVSAGVLPGITRALVLGLARTLGIPTGRGEYPADHLLAASEAFLTASIKEILPIRCCDGVRIGGEIPGPVTRKITQAYREVTEKSAEGTITDAELDLLLDTGGGEQE